MTSFPGVKIQIVASGGQPIVVQGDPPWTGPLGTFLSANATPGFGFPGTAWWNGLPALGADWAGSLVGGLATILPAVAVSTKVGRINTTTVVAPADVTTAVTNGAQWAWYSDESTSNATLLTTNLTNAIAVINGVQSGMAVAYAPTGNAVNNDFSGGQMQHPGLWSLPAAQSGGGMILIQAQRLFETGNITITQLQQLVSALKATTTNRLQVWIQLWTNNTLHLDFGFTQLLQWINQVGNVCRPDGIFLGSDAEFNTEMMSLFNVYRPIP